MQTEDVMSHSAIYQITNMVNGHSYVGSAVNLRERWVCHHSRLRRGKHHSAYLQAAWNLYGSEAFSLEVLEYVDTPELLVEREQHYLDILNPEYNLSPVAGSSLGVKHTEEARQNMSAARMGRAVSAETRRKISEAKRGENSSSAKLTEQNVREIMVLLQDGVLLHRAIAAMYGVGRRAISNIKRGHTWAYLRAAN